MSYALLWIEVLIISLLWLAALVACVAHLRRRWIRIIMTIVILLVPVALLGAFTVATAYLFEQGVERNWFRYATSLLAAFLLGAVVTLAAGRPVERGDRPRAAMWSRSKLALAFIVAAAIGWMNLWNMDLAVRAQAADLRLQAGAMALSLSPAVPDEQNAAIIYMKAFNQLNADTADDGPLEADHFNAKDPATISLLNRQARTITLLRKAAAMQQCRFDRDSGDPGGLSLPPNIPGVAASLLRLHARSELAQGRVDSAMIDVRTMIRMSRHIATDPRLISLLIAFGVDGAAAKMLEEALPAVTHREQLADLDLDEDWARRVLRRSLQGEKSAGMALFSELAEGGFSGTAVAAPVPASISNGGVNDPTQMLYAVLFISDELNAYSQLMAIYQSESFKPYYQERARLSSLAQWRGGLFTQIFVPAISGPFRTAGKVEATDGAATTAIAVTQYRLDHGDMPRRLSDLIPAYLDQLPRDPFNGEPLRLVIKSNNWVVYSVGPDGKDDGGTPVDNRTETGDVVFSLHLRTQPASQPIKE